MAKGYGRPGTRGHRGKGIGLLLFVALTVATWVSFAVVSQALFSQDLLTHPLLLLPLAAVSAVYGAIGFWMTRG